MDPVDQVEVDRVLTFIGDDSFRKGKLDLLVIEENQPVYLMVVGSISVSFIEETRGNHIAVTVVQVSKRSGFRPF